MGTKNCSNWRKPIPLSVVMCLMYFNILKFYRKLFGNSINSKTVNLIKRQDLDSPASWLSLTYLEIGRTWYRVSTTRLMVQCPTASN